MGAFEASTAGRAARGAPPPPLFNALIALHTHARGPPIADFGGVNREEFSGPLEGEGFTKLTVNINASSERLLGEVESLRVQRGEVESSRANSTNGQH